MTHATDNRKITAISIGILVTLLLAVFLCWAATDPQALEPVKEITVTVAHSEDFVPAAEDVSSPSDTEEDPDATGDTDLSEEDENEYVLTVRTTAVTLGDALAEEKDLLILEEGENGPYIAAADGEYSDPYHALYWLCYVNGELLEELPETFPDEFPIEDGDRFYFYLYQK